jgi:hypothetical protein
MSLFKDVPIARAWTRGPGDGKRTTQQCNGCHACRRTPPSGSFASITQ